MTFQQAIIALLIGMLVALYVGFEIGRGVTRPIADIPSNLDVAAALGQAKGDELAMKACYGLLADNTRALGELKQACSKDGVAH